MHAHVYELWSIAVIVPDALWPPHDGDAPSARVQASAAPLVLPMCDDGVVHASYPTSWLPASFTLIWKMPELTDATPNFPLVTNPPGMLSEAQAPPLMVHEHMMVVVALGLMRVPLLMDICPANVISMTWVEVRLPPAS